MRRRKDKLLRDGVVCAACGEKFNDYRDVELSHKYPKGIGGFKRDDRMENLTLLHARSNREQGSMELTIYLRDYWKPEHCL